VGASRSRQIPLCKTSPACNPCNSAYYLIPPVLLRSPHVLRPHSSYYPSGNFPRPHPRLPPPPQHPSPLQPTTTRLLTLPSPHFPTFLFPPPPPPSPTLPPYTLSPKFTQPLLEKGTPLAVRLLGVTAASHLLRKTYTLTPTPGEEEGRSSRACSGSGY